MKNKFLVPIVTPFKANETVDYEALKTLTKKLLNDGADGIYASGSSAECFLLSEEERRKTLEAVIEAADAIASVPPFYFNFPFEGILDYYRRLAETGLPVIVYSLPSATRKLTIDEYRRLLSLSGVIGLKFTDSDYFTMERIITETGADVYSGKDECFLSALAAGAKGAIGTTFNFMLDKYLEIYRLFKAGKTAEALEIQSSANAATECVLENIMPATKYLIKLRYGIDCGNARRPFLPLSEAHKRKLDEIAAKLFK